MNTSMSYLNKEVYVSIDVHKASYSITSVCDRKIVKSATVKANPDALARSFVSWFDGAKAIYSVYEAGFSGYLLHRELESVGIRNIVVNPASIAIASNDKVKTDLRDSKKLTVELSDQRLRAIYIPSVDEELDRLLPRTREQIVEHRGTIARQIKMKLHQFGLISPDENKIISNRYIKTIENKALDPRLKQSLGFLFSQWRFATQKLIEIRALFKEQAAKSSKIERFIAAFPGLEK
jgi:transposase